MSSNRSISIKLFLVICVVTGYSLSLDGPDIIALDSNTIAVHVKTQYLPLGWPAELTCYASVTLSENNVFVSDTPKWILRSDKEVKTLRGRNNSEYSFLPYSLHVRSVPRSFDGSVLECHVPRPGNTTLLSKIHLKVQDCSAGEQIDNNAYNLRNPCSYGKCQLTSDDVVECICFRQYVGIHCNKLKDNSLMLEILPYIHSVIVFIFFMITFCLAGSFKSDKKQEKVLGIAELVGFSDRDSFTLSSLYPLMRKMRKCNYECEEEGKESSGKKRKKAPKKPTAAPAAGAASLPAGVNTTASTAGGVHHVALLGNLQTELWKPAELRQRKKKKRPSRGEMNNNKGTAEAVTGVADALSPTQTGTAAAVGKPEII